MHNGPMNMPWMLTFIDKIAPPLGLATLVGVFVSFCLEKRRLTVAINADTRVPATSAKSAPVVDHQRSNTESAASSERTPGKPIKVPTADDLAPLESLKALQERLARLSPNAALSVLSTERTRESYAREKFSGAVAKRLRDITPPSAHQSAPDLRIEYDKRHHLTKDPSGMVQFRLRVMNTGTIPVRGLKVSLKSLSPLAQAKKLSSFTTQFNDVPLRFAKPELAGVINPGDGIEVFVCFIFPTLPSRLFFSGTDKAFDLPRGKFLASILATAENANPAEQKFEVNASGATLSIKQSRSEAYPPTDQHQPSSLYELLFDRPLASSTNSRTVG